MEALLNYKKEWRKHMRVPESPHYVETLALMRYIFNSEDFLPIQILFYFTLEKESDTHYKLYRHHKIQEVASISFNDLYNLTIKMDENNENFIGFLSKDCGIDYYFNIIKTLYPDKEISIIWPRIEPVSYNINER